MSSPDAKAVHDFIPTLKDALYEVDAAGLSGPARVTRERCFAAYTTSSEWLGEIGAAVRELLDMCGPSLPSATRGKLMTCLNEVANVWPTFRVR